MTNSAERTCATMAVALLALLTAVVPASALTERVSVGSNGTQGDSSSFECVISADGRFVAFESEATNLVEGDTNGLQDIFVRDRQTGQTNRVSVTSGGAQANGMSLLPAISADGRFVAFWSLADWSDWWPQIYLHNRQTGQTTLVTAAASGTQGGGSAWFAPALSSDGRFVAFASEAADLVEGDTNGAFDIFVYETQSGLTTRVSVYSDGTQRGGSSTWPTISGDGRFVAFESEPENLVEGTNAGVFVHDRQSGQTTLANPAGCLGRFPAISADGNFVVSLCQGTTAVVVFDRQTGQSTPVSVNSYGILANGTNFDPTISADGRFIAFVSYATNLVENGAWGIFVHDRLSRHTTLDSVTFDGNPLDGVIRFPKISADGRFVAFASSATNLAEGDTNGTWDVFVAAMNDVPVAVAEAYTTKAGQPLIVTAPGVLGNDMDAEGDTLAAVLVTDVTHGILSLNADGSFAYTSVPDFSGGDFFTYKASDWHAKSYEVTVTITVTAVKPPVFEGDWEVMLKGYPVVETGWGSSANDVFAVGHNGEILHYNGQIWTQMNSGTTDRLYGIWGSSPNDVFAVGNSGWIMHYDGLAWSNMTSGLTPPMNYGPLYGIWGSSWNDVFAVGGGGAILHYNGSAWSKMTSDTTSSLYGIWGSSSTDVFAVGYGSGVEGRGVILHYDGSTWSTMILDSPFQLAGVWGSSSNDVFAIGNTYNPTTGLSRGAILHYDGTTWSTMSSDSAYKLTGIWGSSSSDVFVVGYIDNWEATGAGVIMHYDGNAWSPVMTPGRTSDFSIWGISSNDIFAVAASYSRELSTILHFDGATWSPMIKGTSAGFGAIWGSSPGDVFTSDGRTVLHFDGAAWFPMPSSKLPGGYHLFNNAGIWGSSADDVFAVGSVYPYSGVYDPIYSGPILHYNGSTWSPMNSEATSGKYLTGIWGSSSNDVFAVGGDTYDPNGTYSGTILHYDGSTWSPMSYGTTSVQVFDRIWGSSTNDVFAIGNNETIVHYDGSTWSSMSWSPLPGAYTVLDGIWGSSSNDVFTVGRTCDFFSCTGTILHFNGSTWSTMPLEYYYSVSGIWGSSSTDVFTIGATCGNHGLNCQYTILHYDGVTWSPMLENITYPLAAIWGSSSDDVFAVGANGTILHYGGSKFPVVSVAAVDATATENPLATGQYTVMRTGETSAALTVNFAVTGTATAGSDYISFSTSVTIPVGAASATITVTPINDPDVESPETVVATLSANAAYTIGTPSNATVTIASDDLPPRVQFSRATSSGPESTTPAVISATLSAPSSQTVTVHYATANGTALAGSDYTATSGTLNFNPGETSQTINVPITSDTKIEPNETFTVTLTAPVNATLGAIQRHTHTITNDDFRGSIRLSSATYTVDEAGPTVTIIATRTGGSSGAVGVSYATVNGTAIAGRDFTSITEKLKWADGDTADKIFTVSITNDALDEPDRTFNVRLSAPTGGATLALPSSGTVTITDNDDPPEVQFSLAASSGAESTTSALINVELSAASGRKVTVKYATANGTARSGSDYTARSGILTFTPGVTRRTITVPVVNNTTVETPSDESFTVTLSAPLPTPMNATLGTTTVHTYTIHDEDLNGAIKLSAAAYSIGEAGTATITAMRIGGGSGAVSVKYTTSYGTGTAGSDYLPASGTLSWADGVKANKTFTVAILPDTLDEFNETFTVTLTDSSDGAILGAPAKGVVTIIDNDAVPTVRFSLPASSSGLESTTPAVINVSLPAPSAKTVTVRYATVNGTANRGSDYLATSGMLTFTPGQQVGTITVPIIDDAVVEPNQTFAVTLTTPVNAMLGTPSRHVYTITNDDFAAPDRLGSGNR